MFLLGSCDDVEAQDMLTGMQGELRSRRVRIAGSAMCLEGSDLGLGVI